MNRRKFLLSVPLSVNAFSAHVRSGQMRQRFFNRFLPSYEEPEVNRDLAFDMQDIPFSFSGSFLVLGISDNGSQSRLRLSTVRKTAATYRYQTGSWSHDLYEFDLLNQGIDLSYQVVATPTQIELHAEGCRAAIEFLNECSLRLSAQDCWFRVRTLRPYSSRVVNGSGAVRGFDAASGYSSNFVAATGSKILYQRTGSGESEYESLTISGGEDGLGSDSVAELRLTVERDKPPDGPNDRNSHRDFSEWMKLCPEDRDEKTIHATRIAWFLFWNLQVAPIGGYTRRTILSSKRSLSQIWSWDNLFNALAVVEADEMLAWDQLRVILDHQLESGVLPDTVSDQGPIYGFRKPPLWAWTARRLLERSRSGQGEKMLRAIYPAIVRFHHWWFRERDLRGDGVPVYLSGNDSGWDNASVFESGWPVQSPDLLALLALDAAELATCADRLGMQSEAMAWHSEADRLVEQFHQTFHRDGELVIYVMAPGGWEAKKSTSLLTRIPLLLGNRLEASVRRGIIAELKNEQKFYAACGPASESLDSKLYDPNGYWRGPVWGPSTLLICEGLRSVGEVSLAKTFAQRYRQTCARKADFRENYDAISGKGQFDSGMTWSAADYLLLKQFVID